MCYRQHALSLWFEMWNYVTTILKDSWIVYMFNDLSLIYIFFFINVLHFGKKKIYESSTLHKSVENRKRNEKVIVSVFRVQNREISSWYTGKEKKKSILWEKCMPNSNKVIIMGLTIKNFSRILQTHILHIFLFPRI